MRDINVLCKRFGIGAVPVVPVSDQVLDLVGAPGSFHEAMGIVLAGREAFAAQPAHVRARFLHDPERFIS